MKHNILSIILLISSGLELTAGDHPAGDALKTYLNGKKYVTDMEFHRSVVFNAGQWTLSHVQSVEEAGDYTVTGEEIKLSDAAGAQAKKKPKICKIIWNSVSPGYSEELDCGKGYRFYLESSTRPEGSQVNIAGEPAVALGMKTGEITTKVIFRKKPSKQGAAIRCADGSSPLIVGFDFKIYARTKEKVKVEKWENYWYYVHSNFSPEWHVDPKTGKEVSCEAPAGWVFGEFVKFQ